VGAILDAEWADDLADVLPLSPSAGWQERLAVPRDRARNFPRARAQIIARRGWSVRQFE